MKKTPPHLTGIVILIAILVACGCGSRNSQIGEETGQNNSTKDAPERDDPTKVDIFLKAVEINGEMHLEMYDTKKPGCIVIDGLITDVDSGYTVTWRRAQHSSIDRIEDIRAIDDDRNLFGEGIEEIEAESLWKLEIGDVEPDTVKYEIFFRVRNGVDSIYSIDPYLRVPID